MPVADTIAEIRRYLQQELEEGRTSVEASPDVVEQFKRLAATIDIRALDCPAGRELAAIARDVAGCKRCRLHETRTQTVPGEGVVCPDIMFVGEGPGEEEDRQGRPFVGRAGQLLTRMIAAMGYARDQVFIGNVVKCRPPGNRAPLPDEMETCLPYLKRQISVLNPKVIVALGGTAAKALLGVETGITNLRGQWHSLDGVDLMPTYHPAYLLRNSAGKRPVWEDLQEVLKRLGRPIPPAQKTRQ